MHIEKICYEQLYPTGVYANQRYRVEILLEKDDMVEDAFSKAKTIVEETFLKLNPQIQWSQPMFHPPTESVFPITEELIKNNQSTKDERIQSFIATINMCTSLKFLENFRTRVSQENNPELTEAFNNKLKSFE